MLQLTEPRCQRDERRGGRLPGWSCGRREADVRRAETPLAVTSGKKKQNTTKIQPPSHCPLFLPPSAHMWSDPWVSSSLRGIYCEMHQLCKRLSLSIWRIHMQAGGEAVSWGEEPRRLVVLKQIAFAQPLTVYRRGDVVCLTRLWFGERAGNSFEWFRLKKEPPLNTKCSGDAHTRWITGCYG